MMSVRLDFLGKTLVSGLILVPLILPPFVGAIGMRQILGRFGVLTSLAQDVGVVSPGTPIDWIGAARVFGIILVEALSLYPIMYLNVSAALANLDPAMEQAAANLGAELLRQALGQRQAQQMLLDAVAAALGASERMAQTLGTSAERQQQPPSPEVLDQLRAGLSAAGGDRAGAEQSLRLAEAIRVLALKHGPAALEHCHRLVDQVGALLDKVTTG